jgi:hypothetical protein
VLFHKKRIVESFNHCSISVQYGIILNEFAQLTGRPSPPGHSYSLAPGRKPPSIPSLSRPVLATILGAGQDTAISQRITLARAAGQQSDAAEAVLGKFEEVKAGKR